MPITSLPSEAISAGTMAARASSLATVGTSPPGPDPELPESELDEQADSPSSEDDGADERQ